MKHYECHVTTAYVSPFVVNYDSLFLIANDHKFKLAKLYKWNKEISELDTFMTAHSDSFEELKTEMYKLIEDLYCYGFRVTRYKIEEILLDSKRGD